MNGKQEHLTHHIALTQYSVSKELTLFGKDGTDAVSKEL